MTAAMTAVLTAALAAAFVLSSTLPAGVLPAAPAAHACTGRCTACCTDCCTDCCTGRCTDCCTDCYGPAPAGSLNITVAFATCCCNLLCKAEKCHLHGGCKTVGDRHVVTRTTLSREPKAKVVFRCFSKATTTFSWVFVCGSESTQRFTRRLSSLVLVVDVDSTV